MESPWNYVSDSHASHVIDAINELRKNKELCDVILLVNGHCIPAHRLILSACSPYFHGLFEGHCHSSLPLGNHPIEVPLSGIDACAAENAIDYCYTSHLVIDDDNVWSLLPAASLLQLEEVQNVCCDFLKGRLSLTNCVRMRLMSSSCHCEELTQLCDDFIRNNFERIVSSETFLGIAVESLLLFLSQCLSQRLLTDRLVCDAVQKWMAWEKEQRAACITVITRRLPCVQKLLQPESIPIQHSNYNDTAVENGACTQKRNLLECAVCRQLFPSQEVLQNHMADLHSGGSGDCKNHKTADLQKEAFNSKMKPQAPQGQPQDSAKQEDLDIICQICNKHYHSDFDMTNHCLGHMEGYSPAPEVASTPLPAQCSPRGNSPSCEDANYLQSSSSDSFLSNYKGEKLYRCKICQEEFQKEAQMYSHCSNHHGYGDPPFQCLVCQKLFNDKTKFVHHLVHHSTVVYFCCPFCSKQSRTKANLQIHMRIHTGERPFVCTFCSKGFRNYCVLKVHVRSHTGEKPFKCETCGQSFTKNIHLKRHVSTHSGEKPFSCHICNKGFGRNDHLQRHIKTVHTQEKPHGCNLCGKDFVRRYELERHMRYHLKKGNAKDKLPKRKKSKTSSPEKTNSDTGSSDALSSFNLDSKDNDFSYDKYEGESGGTGTVPTQPYPTSLPGMYCPPNSCVPSLISLDNCTGENGAVRPEPNNNNGPTDLRFVTSNGSDLKTLVSRDQSLDYRLASSFIDRNKTPVAGNEKAFVAIPNPVVLNTNLTLQPNGVTSLPYPIPSACKPGGF